MRRSVLAAVAIAAVFLSVVTEPAAAQRRRAVEFGVDAAFERISLSGVGSGVPSVTAIGIPLQQVRVGIFVQDGLSIEPRLGLARISQDDQSQTNLRATLATLYHIGEPRSEGARPFVLIAAGLDRSELSGGGDSGSETQARLGGGVGLHVVLMERWTFRASAEYHRSFESGLVAAANRIIVAVGLSFFTR